MRHCTVDFYKVVLTAFKQMTTVSPRVIVTDKEVALIRALGHPFPRAKHLLCRWHIGKNVEDDLRKQRLDEETRDKLKKAFCRVRDSPNQAEFVTRLQELKTTFGRKAEYAVRVLEDDEREIVAFAVNEAMHFEQRATSRVEGTHSYLKRRLGNRASTDIILGVPNLAQGGWSWSS